jgi:hypothetical protein
MASTDSASDEKVGSRGSEAEKEGGKTEAISI